MPPPKAPSAHGTEWLLLFVSLGPSPGRCSELPQASGRPRFLGASQLVGLVWVKQGELSSSQVNWIFSLSTSSPLFVGDESKCWHEDMCGHVHVYGTRRRTRTITEHPLSSECIVKPVKLCWLQCGFLPPSHRSTPSTPRSVRVFGPKLLAAHPPRAASPPPPPLEPRGGTAPRGGGTNAHSRG